MTFEVTIVGNNSAIPAHGRYPTAQIVNINEQLFLIDCGEATQIQLQRYKIKKSRINHIFISHLHGDHFYGLIGLLTTYHLLKRQKPLHLFAPPELEQVLEVLFNASKTVLCYELIFHPLAAGPSRVILETEDVIVSTLPMLHRIDCNGFLFREKQRHRKIIKEKIEQHKIPTGQMQSLKEGKDLVLPDGETISNETLTTDPPLPRSYAFCSDTKYNELLVPLLHQVDLLYHEATFDEDSVERAAETYHSTAIQAATIASKAGAKKLLLGHFSAKYKSVDHLKEEARSVFKNAFLALGGKTYKVPLKRTAKSRF